MSKMKAATSPDEKKKLLAARQEEMKKMSADDRKQLAMKAKTGYTTMYKEYCEKVRSGRRRGGAPGGSLEPTQTHAARALVVADRHSEQEPGRVHQRAAQEPVRQEAVMLLRCHATVSTMLLAAAYQGRLLSGADRAAIGRPPSKCSCIIWVFSYARDWSAVFPAKPAAPRGGDAHELRACSIYHRGNWPRHQFPCARSV